MKCGQTSDHPQTAAHSIRICLDSPARAYFNGGPPVGAAWRTGSQTEDEHGWNIFGAQGKVPGKCLGRIKTLWLGFGTPLMVRLLVPTNLALLGS